MVRTSSKMLLVLVLSLAASLFADSGDGAGNSGAPPQYEIYGRIFYTYEKLQTQEDKRHEYVTDEEFAILEKIQAKIVVFPNPELKTMGASVEDPDLGRVFAFNPRIYLHRLKVQQRLNNHSFDFNLWALHEAFQTEINSKTSLGYDADESITKRMLGLFSEKEFQKWYGNRKTEILRRRQVHIYPGQSPQVNPFSGRYITYPRAAEKKQNDAIVAIHKTNEGYFLRCIRGNELNELVFLGKKIKSGITWWETERPIGSSCFFTDIKTPTATLFRLSMFEEGFLLESRSEGEASWRFQNPYVLVREDAHLAYAAAKKRAKTAQEALNYQLFLEVLSGDEKGIVGALAEGADPNFRDWRGRTPLMAGLMQGDDENAQGLENLIRRTNVLIRTNGKLPIQRGHTAFEYTMQSQTLSTRTKDKVLPRLLEVEPSNLYLEQVWQFALQTRRQRLINKLLEMKSTSKKFIGSAFVDSVEKYVEGLSKQKHLVKLSALPMKRSAKREGLSKLMRAVTNSGIELLRVIPLLTKMVKAGMEPDVVLEDERTLLMHVLYLCELNHELMGQVGRGCQELSLLLAKIPNANLDYEDDDGLTALGLAITQDVHNDLVEFLSKKVDIQKIQSYHSERTLLHIAAVAFRDTVERPKASLPTKNIKFLVEQGIALNAQDEEGCTATDYIYETRERRRFIEDTGELLKWLEEKGGKRKCSKQ